MTKTPCQYILSACLTCGILYAKIDWITPKFQTKDTIMTTRSTYKTADKTRDKIIKAARACFAKDGFSGARMKEIAHKARVNQALLYHHFKSKAHLWAMVKSYFIEKMEINRPEQSKSINLEDYLNQIIDERLNLYIQNPQLVRMMLWQHLEPKGNDLKNITNVTPEHWFGELKKLQEQGKIKADIECDLVFVWLTSSIVAPIFTNMSFFSQDDQALENYKQMLLEQFSALLKP